MSTFDDDLAFEDLYQEVIDCLSNVTGWMSDREIKLLTLLAAYPTTTGLILEIGSYRGRSTIAIARGAQFAEDPKIIAVDPHPNSGPMIPDENGRPSACAMFYANLASAGVKDYVEFHQMLSCELAESWNRPIRLLWIDGNHSYLGARADYDQFCAYLSDGAIIAFHDVLGFFEGPVRVFSELLLSRHIGPAGLVGSIGWAQYFKDPGRAAQYQDRNLALYKRLSKLIPYVAFGRTPDWLQRRFFRLTRFRVPHRRLDVESWIQSSVSGGEVKGSTPIYTNP